LKMKAIVILVSMSLIVLERLFPVSKTWIILAPPIVFSVVATILSVRKGNSCLNELPNGLRVLSASVGAALINLLSPLSIMFGILFVLLGIFANDETMRRLYRQKGVIVLTGIDSTGKSTHARNISSWLRSKGIPSKILPFNKYLFLERLSIGIRPHKSREKAIQSTEKRVPPARTSNLSLLRPYLALIDNVMFYILEALPRIARREYVIFDRFIWDNFIKHKALGYNTRLLFRLSTLIRPQIGLVFDLPAEIAFERVEKRERHLRYSIEQYEIERKEFRRIAKMLSYPVVETNEPISQTWNRIETHLNLLIREKTK